MAEDSTIPGPLYFGCFCRGANAYFYFYNWFTGMPIQKIYFTNIKISADNGYLSKDVKDIDFKNVNLILPQKTESLTSK